ncbi:probable photosystem II reaction center W protein, chloroplastic [Coccomyxa sp. Obi]|nr:probable photosystem II reaction center W protein, chloroplastic [Coccomyxa sp. Obi]
MALASSNMVLAAAERLVLCIQVDSRLNGDGTGLALGVGTGAEALAILGVFTLIWTLYYVATKDVGEGRGSGDDSGLTL